MCLRLAASLAGKIAADLGATVLKIEPPGGDPVRRAPPLLSQGESALFQFLNTSKRSLVLDLSGSIGHTALAKLLETADAVLFEEPASVAALLRGGRATPIEIAAFPVEMDAAARPVSGFTLLALGGLLHMVGEPDRKPLRLGGHQASYAAGLTAFTGLAAALAARDAGRTAPAVRVSLAEVMQWVNWKAASGAEASGTSPGREGKASEFQIVPCKDGHVAVVYTATQWPQTRALIGDPRLNDAKYNTRAGRRQHVAEIYAILIAVVCRQDTRRDPEGRAGQGRAVRADLLARRTARHRTICGARLPRQCRRLAHATTSRAVERPLVRAEAGSRSASAGVRGMSTRPLSGVRVLDFGLLTAGANTSAMLADLGADVIKIESGAYLDPFRVVGKPDDDDGWWNRSPQFRFTNRNKRGLAINLKDKDGQRVIRELARYCDIVVENFRRGVLDRAGLGYAELKAVNPRIVFAAISSQGDTGPERMNVSFGSTLDATSGIASLTGYEGEEPRISGMDVNYPDQIVSLFAAGMVVTAVMEARRSGEGCFLDFSQREVASFTLGEEILAASADPACGRGRQGNRQDGIAQQDTYKCRDGRWIAVTLDAPDATLADFCAARDSDAAVAGLLSRGIAAARCNDGIDLLRDAKLAGVTLARDDGRRSGEGIALSTGR